jgi:hypothetical protein
MDENRSRTQQHCGDSSVRAATPGSHLASIRIYDSEAAAASGQYVSVGISELCSQLVRARVESSDGHEAAGGAVAGGGGAQQLTVQVQHHMRRV